MANTKSQIEKNSKKDQIKNDKYKHPIQKPNRKRDATSS